MTTYASPLREMLFAMKEHGGLDAVLAQPGNDDLVLVVNRATALNAMLQTDDGKNLT